MNAIKMIFLGLISSLLLLGMSAFAENKSQQKKRTSINFEDQLIQGEVRKPELFYLLQKKQINFGRLIKLRENFLPEMERSAEEVQRGSGDE